MLDVLRDEITECESVDSENNEALAGRVKGAI